MSNRKTIEQLAEEHAWRDDHEWHSCNGVLLAPVRERSFLAGAAAQRELDGKAIGTLKMLNSRIHMEVLTLMKERDALAEQVREMRSIFETIKNESLLDYSLDGYADLASRRAKIARIGFYLPVSHFEALAEARRQVCEEAKNATFDPTTTAHWLKLSEAVERLRRAERGGV